MGNMSTDTATKVRNKIAPNLDLTPPPRYSVIFLNDDVTSYDFVIAVLMEIFDHNQESAMDLTMRIHEQGQASVAVLPFEIAESKAVEVTVLARGNNFPLNVKLEPEG
jgi:ATP-dependent Clp protease adaptor protein ClpS